MVAEGNVTANGNIWAILQPTNSQIIDIDIIIGIAAILLLIILLYVYGGSYRKYRTKFTLGLVLFASLLVLQNIIFIYILLTYGPLIIGMAVPLFFLSFIEFFALFMLIWVTLE